MSEESETPESGSEAATATALALAGASRAEADAFLRDQRHHLEEQLKQLGLKLWELRFGLLLRLATALVGVAVAAALAFMVWNAAHANGTVVESFSVPPDLAARGLTGEVVAGQLLDKLAVIQTPQFNNVSAAQALSTSTANDVKVEIPETGISIGELYRFLRKWLGHETMVGGEVVRMADGLALTIRVNGGDGASYAGPEAGLDALVQKAAEHVAEVTRRGYASYLLTRAVPRVAEAQAFDERITADPALTPRLRASAWNGLAILYDSYKADLRTGALLFRRARETDPTFPLGYSNQAGAEIDLGHPETALSLLPQAIAVFERDHANYTPEATAGIRYGLHASDAELRGDYAQAVAQEMTGAAAIGAGARWYIAQILAAWDMAQQHDGGAGAWLAQQPMPSLPPLLARLRLTKLFQIEAALEHWPRVIAMAAPTEKAMAQVDGGSDIKLLAATQLRPWLALARAKTGDTAGAEGLITTTPGDCYDCIRARGLIAAAAKEWGRADYWFAKAVADAPSIPFAHEDWGRSLLARGKPDEAIAQFTLSNKKGPHFADPLEGWGEALMAKNQSHLAPAKFAEAEKYAPNWGRLHLKWGEALAYADKKDEAKAHFARAAQLDLTPDEKSELVRAQKM